MNAKMTLKNSFLTITAACLAGMLWMGCQGGKAKAVTTDAPTDDMEITDEASDEGEPTEEEAFDELISEEPMPLAADELFDDFIFNFASNRRLQMERIDFPLIVNSGYKVDTLQEDQWQMEHFFIHQGEYTLMFDNQQQMDLVKDTAVSNVTIEKIFLEQAFIRQYLFSRKSGQWRLCEMRNQTLPRNPNASFIEFYHHFVTDSAFQRESLSDEIVFSGPDPDDDFAQMEGVITPDFWDAFAPELPQRMLFNVVYGHQDPDAEEKIFVLRGISNGLELEMTFRRDGDSWRLTKLME